MLKEPWFLLRTFMTVPSSAAHSVLLPGSSTGVVLALVQAWRRRGRMRGGRR